MNEVNWNSQFIAEACDGDHATRYPDFNCRSTMLLADANGMYEEQSRENFRQYLEGMGLYRSFGFLDDCQNAEQRRGWLAAAEADATMEPWDNEPGYTNFNTGPIWA